MATRKRKTNRTTRAKRAVKRTGRKVKRAAKRGVRKVKRAMS